MAKKTVKFKVARSAITGRFVRRWVARVHPRTTTVETIKRKA